MCLYFVEVSKVPVDNLALLGNFYLYVNTAKLTFFFLQKCRSLAVC